MLAPLVVAVALVTAPTLPPTTATSATAPAPASDEAWYGGPAVATEAASLGVLLLTDAVVVGQRSLLASPLVIAGIAGFALGGPVNHAVHGHLGRAWGSLGLRLGAFLVGGVGAFLVAAGEQCFGEETSTCSSGPIALAFSLPIVVAYVVDDVVWARERPPEPASPDEKLPPRQYLGASLVSGGVLVTAAASLFLLNNVEQLRSAQAAISLAPPGDPGSQFNLEKAHLGRDLGTVFLVAGLGGIGVGAYLLATKPADGTGAVTLAPWADRRASGLSFVGSF
jgi:hypothetical protein